MSVLDARFELAGLDAVCGRGRATIAEVTKALTIAQMHAGVETKIICNKAHQLLDAHALLSGGAAEKIGVKWNDAEEVYELSNGSAIRVTVEVGP